MAILDDVHFRTFVVPFMVGVAVLFVLLLFEYIKWFIELPGADKKRFFRSLPTKSTLKSIWEVIRESLLHVKIFKRNALLGYMHMSLALGWFLLIVTGWIETYVYFKGEGVPLYVDIFFTYYIHPVFTNEFNFAFVKDALLLFILVGVGLALFKRFRSRAMGLKRATKHTTGDRIALGALWFIFPARLVAESMTSAIHGSGSFLTHSLGMFFDWAMPMHTIQALELPCWWFYSICLGVFFVALPFSRYMHIFTEIPLIFLRNSGIRCAEKENGYDKFQIAACSRCGICIDPCQLQRDADIMGVQSVYFLRDKRYHFLKPKVADNCLMCGRCEQACPVGITLNDVRRNSRQKMAVPCSEDRYDYIKGRDFTSGSGQVAYFAGCMTLLTPRILKAMERIFAAAGEDVLWADKEGGVCCGRPLKLSGEVESAHRMMDYNREIFYKHGITTLVTSCPICLKVFREDYDLQGIEVLHHSQYILRLIEEGRISVEQKDEVFTYHDPCELGRGSGIYDEPREVITSIGELSEPGETRENAACCGGSLANTAIDDEGQSRIGRAMVADLEGSGASSIVTSCPLCKKSIVRHSTLPVYDLSEVVADALS